MSRKKLTLELPDFVVDALGSTDAEAERGATRAILLHLLREGCISQGYVAQLLGISRHDVIDLMAKYDIPSGPLTAEEVDKEIAVAEQYLRSHGR